MPSSLPLLSLLIWLPVLGGAALLALGQKRAGAARGLALLVALVTLALSLPLYAGHDFASPAMQFVESREWIPAFDIRYKDWLFLSSRRGLGLDLIQDQDRVWRAGPIINYRLPRYDGESNALSGLGDVDGAVEAGGYVEYTPSPFGGKLEVRQGFGGHHGILVDMGVSYRETLTDELMLNLGPGATWASDDYMETYFGISSAQSARSGYSAFDADAGFKDVSFGGALT